VLHIPAEEARVFVTKERCPLMLCVELYRPEEISLGARGLRRKISVGSEEDETIGSSEKTSLLKGRKDSSGDYGLDSEETGHRAPRLSSTSKKSEKKETGGFKNVFYKKKKFIEDDEDF
jgi:hypothetical protein